MPIPKSRLPKEEWTSRKIKIRLTEEEAADRSDESGPKPGDEWLEVNAEVLGEVAINEGVTGNSRRKWAVTHLKCGLLITSIDRKEDARRVAEYLWTHFKSVLRADDCKEAAALVPGSIRDWLKRCRQTGRWSDPPTMTPTSSSLRGNKGE